MPKHTYLSTDVSEPDIFTISHSGRRRLHAADSSEGGSAAEIQRRIDALDGDDQQKVGMLFTLAVQQVHSEQFEQAMTSCRISRRLAVETEDTVGACRALVMMGYLYARIGEYVLATSCFAQCVQNVGGVDHADTSAAAWLAIGGIHEYMGNDPEAKACYERSVALFNETGNVVGEVEGLTKLAGALGRGKDMAGSLVRLLRALVLYQELQLPEKVAATLLEIGELYQHNGELHQALAYLGMARSRGEELKIPLIEGRALMQIARIHLHENRGGESLQAVSAALALNIDSLNLLSSLHEIAAAAYEAGGDVEHALEHYKLFLKSRNQYQLERQRELFTDLSTRLSLAQVEHERSQLDEKLRDLHSRLAETARENAALGLRIIQRERAVEELERQLEDGESSSDGNAGPVRRRNHTGHSAPAESDWQIFETLFDDAHREFLRRLSALHHSLTQTELRVCSLIRLGLATKDIAQVLFVSVRNIQNHKYRLRKRLGLEAGTTIESYLASV